jgi:hypothetical protein
LKKKTLVYKLYLFQVPNYEGLIQPFPILYASERKFTSALLAKGDHTNNGNKVRIDVLAIKHLRSQRRLNPHTLFLSFRI